MREKFESRNLNGAINIRMDDAKGTWSGDKQTIVQAIVDIAIEYRNAGYVLTLRQCYYQLVARDIVPNHDKVYAKISAIKDDVVYSGLVDWDVFEDRGRVPIQAYFEEDVKDSLRRTIRSYRLDRQIGQPNLVEVWTEKDAISSILRRVTDPHTLRLVVNKGYTSSTAIYGAYERFVQAIAAGQKIRILYFGDHDPSGIDMIRDINDRLMFMFTHGEQLENEVGDEIQIWWETEKKTIYDVADLDGFDKITRILQEENYKLEELFEVGRRRLWLMQNEIFEIVPVGLTMPQIKKYRPPHNPAKITDPRAKGYIRKYGAISWEVDALRPELMIEIVQTAIDEYMDSNMFNEMLEQEQTDIALLTQMIDNIPNEE